MSDYEIGMFGGAGPEQRGVLVATLGPMVSDFGLRVGRDVSIRLGDEFQRRSMHSAGAAAYFGMADPVLDANTRRAVANSLPVIPVVPVTGGYDLVPEQLRTFNGLRLRENDPGLEDLASALLDCLGLLRRQRRAFVSYRRVESRNAAVQLHDLLSGRGFDVFLDTHDIRPGEPFQEVLWNRLCDSDVMVMLDTPTYFASKWTRQELGRARVKEIHVLRVVWPAHAPDAQTDFAETVNLDLGDLVGGDGPISDDVAENIVRKVENLRSRSIASRHRSIAGRLRAEVRKIGGEVEGFGAHRALAVRLPDGRRLWAYPVVGVPTAELLNDVEENARRAAQDGTPILIYDHVGVRGRWATHLRGLDDNIRSVRAISIGETVSEGERPFDVHRPRDPRSGRRAAPVLIDRGHDRPRSTPRGRRPEVATRASASIAAERISSRFVSSALPSRQERNRRASRPTAAASMPASGPKPAGRRPRRAASPARLLDRAGPACWRT